MWIMQHNSNKHVVFVMPTLDGGGAERVVSIISNYLVEKDFEVSIYLLRSKSIAYELNPNIEIKTMIPKSDNGIIKKIQTIKSLKKLMRDNSQAVFISFMTNENIYLTLSALGLSAKVVVSERNDPYKTIHGKLKRFLINSLYGIKQCRQIVFQTTGAMGYYDGKVQKKGIIIPNPIKSDLPESFTGVRSKEIVSFARLEPQKNYPMLIDAFEMFSREHEDYTLGIYGQGEQEKQLKLMVKEKGIDNKVTFYGFCADVHNRIRNAAMFVLASDYEGLSNSMLEALAIGLPCVCTDCSPGGAKMFIKNGENGFLVPTRNPVKMYEAMNQIVSDKRLEEKISANASKIRTQLSVDSVCKMWADLIHNLF